MSRGLVHISIFLSFVLMGCSASTFSASAPKRENARNSGNSTPVDGSDDPTKNGSEGGEDPKSGIESGQTPGEGAKGGVGGIDDGFSNVGGDNVDTSKTLITKPESDHDGYVVGVEDFTDSTFSLKAPRFGLLVNDLRCAICHLEVNGDVSSIGNVDSWHPDAVSSQNSDTKNGALPPSVSGSWFVTGTFSRSVGKLPVTINVRDGIKENYSGREIPTKNGVPTFPSADFNDIKKKVTGVASGKNEKNKSITIKKVFNGNLVLLGTKSSPIKIRGDIMVTGDLVIKGVYTGVGSIYVQGRVYIPGNLVAKNSVFPYPNDRASALEKAEDLIKTRTGDALGIATPNSVFIAQLSTAFYDDHRAPPRASRGAAGVDEVYSWYPDGRTGYEKLYETGTTCDSGIKDASRSPFSFNLVEAFLYAANTIGGISHSGSWAINGGVMADSVHIIGSAGHLSGVAPFTDCRAGNASPVHRLPMSRNFVNYDYRLQRGLRLLSHLTSNMK